MKIYHVLNGDCLAEKFPEQIAGEVIVWREALVYGPLNRENFFENREKFIRNSYGIHVPDYHRKIIVEFEKIRNIPEGSTMFFWFEDDLFCQVNFWFLLSNLSQNNLKLFAVHPIIKDENSEWKGFGNSDQKDLIESFNKAVEISKADFQLAKSLWLAFSNQNIEKLVILAKSNSQIFRKLKQIIPLYKSLREGNLNNEFLKIQTKNESFLKMFRAFSEKFGALGFGDLQFKNILEKLNDGKLS